jgi:hypothetical protein
MTRKLANSDANKKQTANSSANQKQTAINCHSTNGTGLVLKIVLKNRYI